MMGPLALLFGLPTAVVSVAVIDAGAAPAMLRRVWRIADRKRALLAAGAAALTLPLGTYILQTQDPTLLRQIAGVGILAFVVLISWGFKWRGGGMPVTAAAGATGGLIGGATSLIGPPVILYFLARNDPADRTRATLAIYISAVVFSQAIILAIAEAKSSVAGWDAWMNAALLIPIYVAGIYLGRRLFGYASPSFYRRVALVLVTVAGVLAVAG